MHPWPKEDKNIPTEAAKMLTPVIAEVYGLESDQPSNR